MTGNEPGRNSGHGIMILACSGAADVGGVADMAARKMAKSGAGRMHCLAGVGGNVPAVMSDILSASRIMAIDGCERNCAKETLTKAGLPVSIHLCLADLGMEKGKTPVTLDVIEEAAAKAADLLGMTHP